MVVDDSPTDRLRMVRMLRQVFPHAHTLEVSDGEEAIAMLERQDFAVLLTDQNMGKVAGIAVLKKAKELRPNTLRLMMTAEDNVRVLTEALHEGGVQGYILKKWSGERIAAELKHLLSSPRP